MTRKSKPQRPPATQQPPLKAQQHVRYRGWEILRDAPAELVEQLPPPAHGRYVIALDPPALDGYAELRGETRDAPRGEYLALVWTGNRGEEVLHPLDRSGCLLSGCQLYATWLPEDWTMAVFPAAWTLPHLKAWFGYALSIAGDEKFNNDRKDIPPGSDKSPAYAPTPRGFVTHAHLIVRHLGLPNPPVEPRGPMDRAGCLAELREVLAYFLGALQPGGQQALQQKAARLQIAGPTAGRPLTFPPPDGGLSTVWYHGGRSYSTDGETPSLLPTEEHNALSAFLDRGEALDTKALEKAGVSNVSAVMGKLSRRFGDGVRLPKAKGEGYFVRVRTTAQSIPTD
jgi:hypothetical protein